DLETDAVDRPALRPGEGGAGHDRRGETEHVGRGTAGALLVGAERGAQLFHALGRSLERAAQVSDLTVAEAEAAERGQHALPDARDTGRRGAAQAGTPALERGALGVEALDAGDLGEEATALAEIVGLLGALAVLVGLGLLLAVVDHEVAERHLAGAQALA